MTRERERERELLPYKRNLSVAYGTQTTALIWLWNRLKCIVQFFMHVKFF